MFVLTIATAFFEIVYGIKARSNSLIADGLYSFAEGLCLIGVLVVLHYARDVKHHAKKNTFGYERLELLFGLIQEVFLVSISLGIIVDALNHLIHPMHVHDPKLVIILGTGGMIIGILGIVMFWGYHHDHNIAKEISDKKKGDFLVWTKKHSKEKRANARGSRQNTIVEDPLVDKQQNVQTTDELNKTGSIDVDPQDVQTDTSILNTFTYENVQIAETRVYATLHALCLHSWEKSIIVVVSGLMFRFIPHTDPITGKEINSWLKYVDPILTLVMVVIVAVNAIPVILSISKVLIENVPGGIDTRELMDEIVTAIPAIKSIHSLHIWRATSKDIYATLHVVCDEDVKLSTCTNIYGRRIQKILKGYCIAYFTLQYEYIPSSQSNEIAVYPCVHGLHRKRRGHNYDEPMTKLAKEAILHIGE
ncbi:unnamed protein product [Rotaria sp. Silwood1]|nr:unnamed protein product [Rotaria sp. Silwood1]CAF0969645.1 unnamed protein product [Rotaria sp. Silwood1]CAF4695563.1 unnamed protein product [Rotaria sp. Silwood1]